MDIKIDGITEEIMKDALEQAREGRLHILGIMNQPLLIHVQKCLLMLHELLTLRIPT